jgi:hypothetical protein
MDALTLSAVCILCAAPSPPLSPALAQWQPLIAQAATRFAIPEAWIVRVMQAESGGHLLLDGRSITSTAGAMGLMQLMPQTYADLRLRYGFGADPYAPRDNIFAGAAYLRAMYERYGYPNLFAAYNAGPHRVDEYLLQGRSLPAATSAYVATIIPHLSDGTVSSSGARSGAAVPPDNRLFVALNSASAAPTPRAEDTSPDNQRGHLTGSQPHDLFVPLTGTSP